MKNGDLKRFYPLSKYEINDFVRVCDLSILPDINPKELSILEQSEISILAIKDKKLSKINLNNLDYSKLKITSNINDVRVGDFIFEPKYER